MKPLVILLAVAALTGCQSGRPKNTSNAADRQQKQNTMETITDKYWKLIELEGKPVTMAANQEREIFFTLKSATGQASGFAGCNTFNGTFSLEAGNRIRFSDLATSLRACPDVAVNEQEVLEVFRLADNYTLNKDMLQLNIGRRAPLATFKVVYF